VELDAELNLVGLRDASDFGALKVLAAQQSHVWVSREEFVALAGDQANDPSWLEGLDKMFAYAESHGWVNEDGAVRAHVEWS
jgi:hypothetical protein